MLDGCGVKHPTYLDLGANDPVRFSNTYLLYTRGAHGVCVEPHPDFCRKLRKKRPRDTVVNCGIGTNPAGASDTEFFVMDALALSTFSRSDAMRLQESGHHRIVKTISVPLRPVNEIIDVYCDGCPDLISVDVEGFEHQILATLDTSRFRPLLLCVETLTYSPDSTEGLKTTATQRLLESRGYMVYADTYINTIMVDKDRWYHR